MAPDADERTAVRDGVPSSAEVGVARDAGWSRELSRKAIHLTSSVFPLSWAFGVADRRVVVAALTLALFISTAIEISRRRDAAVGAWFARWFGHMLRNHEHRRLTGATWILVAMLIVAATLPERAAISALWAAVVGDAAAALVGRAASAASRRRPAKGKTWAGSIACALASAIGPWWLVAAGPLAAGGIGLAAALAERPRLALDDNVRVAIAAGIAAMALGVA